MREHAAPWRHVDFSLEAWDAEFPNSQVHTPIGDIKLGANQRDKLSARAREHYFGLIKPTLEAPTYVVFEPESLEKLAARKAAGQTPERISVLKFFRAFRREDGKIEGFCCVTVTKDGLEIMISSGPKRLRQIARSVRSGAILTMGSALTGETTSPGREDGLTKAVSYRYLTAWDAQSQQGVIISDWGLFKALAGLRLDEFPLLKRMMTPTGARWITVHPNGKDSPGVPVMIQESRPGSGVYHIIGGAGGKLNYLKLRGIKPGSTYKKEAAERRKLRQAEAQRQRERDREAGLETSKKKEKEAVAARQYEQEKTFIANIAKIAGWTEKETQFDSEQYAHLSPRAYQEVRNQHHAQQVRQAKEFVDQQTQQLLADPEHLKQALGEIPLTAPDPTTLTVNDLDPVRPPDQGQGFAANYAKRAAEQTEGGKSAVQVEAEQIKQKRLEAHPEHKAALASRQATAQQLKQELATARLPEPPITATTDVLPVAQVMDLLKQRKALDQATQTAQKARKKIDEASDLEEIKAYNLDVGGRHIEDDEIVQDLEDVLRTTQTRALLAEAKKISGDQSPEQALSRHVSAGAQAALDALGLTVAGQGLLDRSVVDVLGMEGAARAMAHRLHATLDAKEMETLQQALSDYHVDHYTRRGEAALQEAKTYQDEAAQIELDAAQNGADLQQAQGLNRRRIQALAQARRVLGTCLGEFEMNAALVQALKAGRTGKPLEVALGKVSLESAIAQAKAIGLQSGDYTLDTLGGVQFLTVQPDGLDRLTQPLDADHLRRQRTALDILNGRRDEDPWLPKGVADRPDLAAPTPPGVAPTLAQPFDPRSADHLSRALEDYIGGRTADGDAPADILSDVLANSMVEKAEVAGATRDQYMAAVNALAPSRNATGKLLRAEAHSETFQRLADQFVERQYGGQRSALHRQDVPMDEVATDALHRALSVEPAGIAAFKAIGDLTDDDQRALRTFFTDHVAKDDPDAITVRQALTAHEKQEPEKETTDMFGETSVNPAWQDWQNRRNELAESLNAMTLDWPKYVQAMHGRKNAYAAMQDLIRSRVTEQFQRAYNTLRPNAPLKLGRQVIRSNLNHLDAIDPEARADRLSQERALIDSLRNRVGGKYAEGSVIEKLENTREQQEAMAQNQMGFFGAEEEPRDAPPSPLKADERHTLGHVVEQRLAAMLGVVGKNFKPGEAIKLWNPSMSGPDHVARQRAIKLIEANRRVALSLGTGTGKSLIGLGAFTDLHAQGHVQRGIFAVPSIVQGQMGVEALRYLTPRQYQWHAEPGASRAERIAALKDPKNHFVVTTHQSLRDDLLHLGAQHEGITPEQLADRLGDQSPQDRAAWMKDLLNREGIDAQYLMVDEGHGLLNRAGKENSRMANVLDALSANTPYYINASADPVKNSVDEAFDLLAKMDPARYTDRAAFMRRYGVDSSAARAALQRELAPYQITGRIESGQAVQRRQETVPLSDAQRRDLDQVSRHLANLRLARMKGAVDVEAARALSPDAFAKAPTDQHVAIARRLARSIGVLKEAAINRILNSHPDGGKLAAIDRMVNPGGELHGQPGVIFAHNREAVRHIAERLQRAGHRVVTLTGSDSSKVKAQKKAQFAPEAGPAQADILVTSDAGAVGMNAQRGRWMIQHDTPQTAMNHNQRNGRVDRVGQQHEVQLIDLVHDHPAERTARERLSKKYELREIMTAPQIGLDDTGLAGYLVRQRAEMPEPVTEEPLAKAVFQDQPGYDLRAGPKGKNRWMRQEEEAMSAFIRSSTIQQAEREALKLGVKSVDYQQSLDIANIVNDALDAIVQCGIAPPDHLKTDDRIFIKWATALGVSLQDLPAAFTFNRRTGKTWIYLNPQAPYWADPVREAQQQHQAGRWSSDHPHHAIWHELGHLMFFRQSSTIHWLNPPLSSLEMSVAAQIGRQAKESIREFMAETFAALLAGRSLPADVLHLYRQYGGVTP